MATKAELSYIEQTEIYIKENQDNMPEDVFQFIKTVCRDERKYLEMLQQWSQEKRVLKVKP